VPAPHRIADASEMERMLRRVGLEIAERNRGLARVALVGIQSRGVPLARRLAGTLESDESAKPPLGTLDISFYRDDFDRLDFDPDVKATALPFDVTGMHIVLVDDVLYTGRTIRAAMDEIMDFGRPATIQLAVLVDRGGRELPIAPTFVGMTAPARRDEAVRVHLKETDGEDAIWVAQREEARR
jgi:pyrimidine operon attenuation protein/uracil phosphoribosyltransferase